jgi:hypothetical protein
MDKIANVEPGKSIFVTPLGDTYEQSDYKLVDENIKVSGTPVNLQEIIKQEPIKKDQIGEHPVIFRFENTSDTELNTTFDSKS